MVADPEMIKDILIKEFPKFHDRKVNVKFECCLVVELCVEFPNCFLMMFEVKGTVRLLS